MNYFSKNGIIYVVVSGRDTPGVFCMFRGMVVKRSEDNYYIVSNLESMEGELLTNRLILGNYFIGGRNLGYREYKKVKELSKFSLIVDGLSCFATKPEAQRYREKLEYDFFEYFLKNSIMITNRNESFSEFRDSFSNLYDKITKQRIDSILKTTQ